MEQKYGHYNFKVEPFEEDITGVLSWGTLGKVLLRAASQHAASHGFGFDNVNSKSHAWVLSRLVVELLRRPQVNEEYAIESWVTRVYRQFTDRHFDILSSSGERIGQATSIWALIDMETRMPADLTSLAEGRLGDVMLPERAITIAGPSRIRLSKEAALLYVHKAAYSDLDINGHVNSIRYIELLLNTFDLSVHKERSPKRIEVAYCLESYCGEQLEVYGEQQSDGVYAFEIRRGADCIVKSLVMS